MVTLLYIYADTFNTSQEAVNVGYVIEAVDNDNYLSSYSLRLIINGGPMNGGEMLESSGDFEVGLMSSSISGFIEIPMGSTEGQWNIRIILRDDLDAITNIGPNDLQNLNFQNYIIKSYQTVKNHFFLYEDYLKTQSELKKIKSEKIANKYIIAEKSIFASQNCNRFQIFC